MKIVFAGTPTFAAGFLDALLNSGHEIVAVVTQPDKPGKRGTAPVPGPVRVLAESRGLTVLQPARLAAADLAGLIFDILIVVAYGQILKQDLLDLPRYGGINVHASLLPKWRGAAPVQRAILAGDATAGVTLIQMDAGLDTGDILAGAAVPVTAEDTAASVFDKLAQAGQPLLVDTLQDVADGRTAPKAQSDKDATYAPKLDKKEALIDWSDNSQAVSRQVRAFYPRPIAFTFLAGRRIKVHAGRPAPAASGEPGRIIGVDKAGVLVACGRGAYLIERIQLPLGKGAVLNGADVLNGWKNLLAPGLLFGDAGQ